MSLPLSVVVTASGSPRDFATCLDALRPELRPQDEVVCVVPADRADLRGGLPARAWIRVVEDGSGDQARRWSAGVAATSHPVVVLLDGDVVGSPRWLDEVRRAFTDPGVVAAGPRCQRSYGPQRVDLPPQALASPASFRSYARQWREEHGSTLTGVDRLGPVCVAVRRDALARAGGPTLDMPYEELRAQGRLVVAEGALVAHVGSAACSLRPAPTGTRPLVSVSMIVKDEEDVLADCLTAAREFADEVVVYDTGSTDRTREIAREHGARVIEGYWNDHFAEARNRSIAQCQGEWIFIVDADEVARGDAGTVRAKLAGATVPAVVVQVNNIERQGHEGRGVLSVRLFRRYHRYDGRLHEQVVDGITGDPAIGPWVPEVSLVHTGYTDVRFAVKNKGDRNLRLAERAAEGADADHTSQLNLARSQLFAGKFAEAVASCQRALAAGDRYRQTFLETLVQAATDLRRFDLADSGIAELRQLPGNDANADDLEARLRFAQGDHAAALAIVERQPETATGSAAQILTRRQFVDVEVLSLHGLGRYEEAADLLGACLARGELPFSMVGMVAVLAAAGRPIATIAEAVPRTSRRDVLLAAAHGPVAVFDELLEAFWSRYPGDGAVLAFAVRVGGHLPLLRALEWSVRLRQQGLGENCTLLALAGTPERSARDRVLAGAVALEMFGDQRAMPLLESALADVTDEEAGGVLDEMRKLAPGIAAAVEPAGVR